MKEHLPDAAIHCGIALAYVLLFGWWANPWFAAAGAIILFYAREQTQQDAKKHPPIGWRRFAPWCWGVGGITEFVPTVPVSLLTATGVHFFH